MCPDGTCSKTDCCTCRFLKPRCDINQNIIHTRLLIMGNSTILYDKSRNIYICSIISVMLNRI